MAHGNFHFPATIPASWHLLIRIMSSAVPREKIWVLLAKRIISQKYSSEHQLQYSTLTYALLSSSLRKKKKGKKENHCIDIFSPGIIIKDSFVVVLVRQTSMSLPELSCSPQVHICSIVAQIKRGDWMIRGFFSPIQLAAECFFTLAWFLVSWPTEQWRPLYTAETVLTGG